MAARFYPALIGVVLLNGFITVSSQAQSSTRKFRIGLKLGANFSQLANLNMLTPRLTVDGLPVMSAGTTVYDFFQHNQSWSIGVVGGIFARYGNRVFIQPELLLSSKGGSFDVIQPGLATQSVKVRLTTVDLPILIGVQWGPLRINAGPVVSLAVSEKNGLADSFRQYAHQSINQTKQAVYGYQAGVGLSIRGLQLDLRREGGLGSILPTATKCGCSDLQLVAKTNSWQLTAGYSF